MLVENVLIIHKKIIIKLEWRQQFHRIIQKIT